LHQATFCYGRRPSITSSMSTLRAKLQGVAAACFCHPAFRMCSRTCSVASRSRSWSDEPVTCGVSTRDL
jgi:hypothetical protein